MARGRRDQPQAEAGADSRRVDLRSAAKWACALVLLTLVITVALAVSGANPSWNENVVAPIVIVLALALLTTFAVMMVRLGDALLPYRAPGRQAMGDPGEDLARLQTHAQTHDQWVRRTQIAFGACAVSMAGIVFAPSLTTFFGWAAAVLGAGGFISLVGMVIHGDRAATEIDRYERDSRNAYGHQAWHRARMGRSWSPFHWWEWVAMFVLIIGACIGAVVLMDSGMQAGWLPGSRRVAESLVGSLAAVFIVSIVTVWGLIRSPDLAARRPALILVTLIAAAASLLVGIIGSYQRWRPFMYQYSGRPAGAILGGVFVIVWVLGFRLTKRRHGTAS